MRIDFDRATLTEIEQALREDGYDELVPRAYEIRRAGQNGALVWTRDHLTTTDASRINARPRREGSS